jgi:RNA polymerase sigma-70 factor (ECF subfamily)
MLGSRLRGDKYYIKQVLKGRQEAYAVLVDRYMPVLHAVVAARLDEPGDVDDAVQETFIRAYRSLSSLEKPGSFGPWVSTIARRTAFEFHRQRRQQREAQAIVQRASEEAWTPGTESERLEVLRAELDRLPEEQRELLLMRYFAGKSVREVAHLAGIAPAAAAKRLQRAREALGERVVSALAQARAPEEQNEQRRKVVMSLVAPLPIPGLKAAATKGAVAGATAFTVLKVGVGVVAVAVVTVAALKYATKPQRSMQSEVTLPVAVAETVGVDTPEVVVEEEQPAERASAVPAAQASAVPDLSGDWDMVIPAPSEKVPNPPREPFTAEYDAEGLVFTPKDPRLAREVTYTAVLNGRTIVMTAVRVDPQTGRSDTARAEGEFDRRYTIAPLTLYHDGVITGKGFLLRPDARMPRMAGGGEATPEATPEKQHAEMMAQALGAFYLDYGGSLPATLTALHPAYLSDASAVEPLAGREMLYYPQNALPKELPAVNVTPDMFDENLPLADRLMMCEQTLERESMVADIVFPKPILEITYSGETPARYVVYNAGKPGAFAVHDETDSLLPDAGARLRASCQNNLKQLGLVIKMFQGEQREEHSPPGWLYVYPQYVNDPRIFCCPLDPLGTDSYHYLFPATRLAAFAEELGVTEAELPLVMDREPTHEPGGYNVLFADGHVSFIRNGAEWQQKIGPFLALAAP